MSKFSVKKPLTVFVVIIGIIILGIVSFSKMTLDLLPNINLPYVAVITTYPGASPESVESSVTKPIEKAVASVEGLKNMTSTSNENYSSIFIEFNDGVNMDSAYLDLREKISLIEETLPDSVATPYMMKMNPNMMPIMVSAVSYDKSNSNKETSEFLNENVVSALEGTDGVASVSASGLVEEGISVELDQKKIDKVNKRLASAISSQFASSEAKLASSESKLNNGKTKISTSLSSLKKQQKSLKSALSGLNNLQSTLSTLESNKSNLENTINTLEGLSSQISTLESILANSNEGSTAYNEAKAALKEIDTKLNKMGLTRSSIATTLSNAKTSLIQVNSALNGIDAKLKKQGMTRKSLPSKIQEVNDGLTKINSAITTLNLNQQNLKNGANQISSGKSQIASVKNSALASADISKTLTKDTISSILMAQNFSMPAGYVTEDGLEYLVRVGDKVNSVEKLQNLVIMDAGIAGMKPIYLKDVAKVYVSDNSDSIYAKINGKDGVAFALFKQSNYSTTEVCDNVNKKCEELSKKYDGLNFTPLMDQGDYIHIVVNSVLQNLIIGAVLAIIILLIFLKDIKPTGVIAVSIPVSVLMAVVLMYFSGITLNVISLSGLAVGVGMLVDNSVVVIENIYRLRNKGYSAVKSAVSGAKQVAGAITASTLTTICVFLPIVFVKGITKDLFTDMALTIGYSLLASLFIALTLVPAVSSKLFREVKEIKAPFFEKLLNAYEKAINWALDNKKKVIIFSIVLLFGSFGLLLMRGFSFMPDMSSDQISVTMEMPKDNVLEDTIKTSDIAVSRIEKIDGVDTVAAMLTSTMSAMQGMGSSKSDASSVSLYVLRDTKSKVSSKDISKKIEDSCKDLKCEVSASGSSSISDSMSALGGSGVSIKLYGSNLDKLQKAAKDIGSEMKKVEGIDEVDSGLGDSTPEIRITVDKKKAMKYNLTVASVYTDVSNKLTTDKTATTLTLNNGEYDVTVKDGDSDKLTPEFMKKYKVSYNKQDGSSGKVALNKIASITNAQSVNAVNRENQKRYMTINGTLKDGYNISIVTNNVKDKLDKYSLPDGCKIEYSGENQNIMDSMVDLLLMLALGIIIIYLIMVAQFQSLKSPFIVMFVIPLAFTGGFLGLLLTGKEISVISMIGFVMLCGIIVNNGIVLIDYINQLVMDGKEKREAIIEAGLTRMRPILITALTTILGLLVMALGIGNGAEMMQPIAIVCEGGLIYATFMTLFIVPVLYDIFNKKKIVKIDESELDFIDD